jgi:hypothetical protein
MKAPTHSFNIWPTATARNIDHIEFENIELRINPHTQEQFPLPWDAGFTLNEGNYLVLEGWAGPGGFGCAEVCLRKDEWVALSGAEDKDKPFWILVDCTLTQAACMEQFGWEVKGTK